MSMPSSNGQQKTKVSIDEPVDDHQSDSVLTLDDRDTTRYATPISTLRPGRGTDYRLRGLDLGAQHKAKPPVLVAPRNESRRRHRRRLVIGWVIIVALAAGVAVLLRGSIVQPFAVPSNAMMPTLHAGDRILVLKPRSLAGPIEGGNIVVFRQPAASPCGSSTANAQDLVERVIGMPGQTVWSEGNAVYVNGHQLKSPYPHSSTFAQLGSNSIPLTTVPTGEYFVMGDNRAASCDSRVFGAIPASSIVGKAVSIVVRSGHPHIHVF